MSMLSETAWVSYCFTAWSQSHRTARFAKRANWELTNPSVATSFLEPRETVLSVRFPRTLTSPKMANASTMILEPGGDTCIIPPGSTVRVIWDLVCAVMLVYDLLMIPIFVFGPRQDAFMYVMEWLSMTIWTGDMFMSCITGFVEKGIAVMDRKRILVNYLKTWFALDVITVCPDWVLVLSGNAAGAGDNQGRLLRALRLVRAGRLLRLAKFQRVLAMVRDRIDSEMMFIAVNIAKLLLSLLMVNHILAAAWYGVGVLSMDLGLPNWIEDGGFRGESLGYRYTTSLHWSLTQFTPASMEVQPCNFFERTFAITCLVLGLVIFSSFISSITSAVAQIKNLSDNKAQQFWLLRRYLRQNSIDRELFFRILRYADYACRERNVMVTESRLWVLQLLSEELRNEVQYQVSFACLRCLPLFEEMRCTATSAVHQLVSRTLQQRSLATKDVLFSAGSPAAFIYVIVCGELHYTCTDECEHVPVLKEDWLCEPAFWTPWMHVGSVQAKTETKIVSIEVASFMQVISHEKRANKLAASYCHFYLAWLNSLPLSHLTDLSKGEIMRPVAKRFLEESRKVRSIHELQHGPM